MFTTFASIEVNMAKPPVHRTPGTHGAGLHGPAKAAKTTKSVRHPFNQAPPFAAGNTAGAGPRDTSRSERLAAANAKIAWMMENADRQETQLSAAFHIRESIEGKARQAVEMSGVEGGPIHHAIAIEFIEPTEN